MWNIAIRLMNETPLTIGFFLSGGAGIEATLEPNQMQDFNVALDPGVQPFIGVHQSTGERLDFVLADQGVYQFGFQDGKIVAAATNVEVNAPVTAQVVPPSFSPPPQVAPPRLQACFQCGGSGKSHHSSMPHSENGCIFCSTCVGCGGTGAIPGEACLCPKCQGQGRCHDSSMPHTGNGCIFCSECSTCQSKGWI